MKIFCIGRNYLDHINELNNTIPKNPLIFMKPSTALLIDEKPFYHPDFSNNIHHEIELVLKIKKNGKHILPAFAKDYYDEIGLGIDFTARDLQDQLKEKGQPWEIAKSFDFSAVVGKFLNKDKLDLNCIEFSLKKNKETVQKGCSKDLIFNFDFLLTYISKYFTVQVGDLIFTGTPSGVGAIKIGDVLEGYIGEDHLLLCEIR